MAKADFGLIGLGTMGASLARNVNSRGFSVSTYNRSPEKVDQFVEDFGSESLTGHKSLEDFVNSLATPRKIILMVKAGAAVDAVIEQLNPLLKKGDIIIDGGNSHYPDTNRREAQLKEQGLHFVGMGISGGEKGALEGPSMMPGGSLEAFEAISPILQPAAAEDGLGGKCFAHIGPAGSGHFVKMVHNGIEYGVMQLIAEAYDILKNIGGLSNEELAQTFAKYNETKNSYLLEITAKIFEQKEDGQDLIDLIKDAGKQKGTGKWTSIAAYDYGVSLPTIHAAVDARIMSGSLNLRRRPLGTQLNESPAPENLVQLVEDALDLSSLCTYFQGFELMKIANVEEKWNLDFAEIARIWRGGCIIRASYLETLQNAYASDEETLNKTREELNALFDSEKQKNWRSVISLAASNGIQTPCLSASLFYYDGIRREKLPQNLTQAQRDFFGAHTYQRSDKEGTFHTDWNN